MEFERRELGSRPFVCIRASVPRDQVGAFLGPAYGELQAFIDEHGMTPTGCPMSLYYAVRETHFDMAAALTVEAVTATSERITGGETPGGPALVGEHRGPYDQLKDVWPLFDAELERAGAAARAPCWEEYVTDPGAVPDPADWRTVMVQPLQ